MAKILVVDDDPNIRFLLCEVLQREKHKVTQASDGSEAIDLLHQAHEFELVISDLHMKRVDGIQVLRTVKEKRTDLEVLILTGYGTVNSAVQAMKLGAFDYLTKPLNIEELKFKVNQALNHRIIKLKVHEQAHKLQHHQEMIERDLKLAATIQETLLPRDFENQLISISVNHQPIIGVGGDFADIFIDDNNCLYCNIVDVTGHGIAAALIVNRICSEVYKLVRIHLSPKDILFHLNNFIFNTFQRTGMFLTAFSCQIDINQKELYYAGCAHPPLMLWNKNDQEVCVLKSQNSIIGFQSQEINEIVEDKIKLSSGDKLFLYTDGIVEVENETGQALGIQGLSDVFRRSIDFSGQACINKIIELANQYRKKAIRDDIYLLLAELK